MTAGRVPASFPVRPIRAGSKAAQRAGANLATCGACGRSWDDSIATDYTPAPGGRCPFEYYHKPEQAPRKTRVCFSSGGPNPFKDAPEGAAMIELIQHGRDKFTVRYGLQVKTGLDYSDAALELGACLMHLAACDGLLDNQQG